MDVVGKRETGTRVLEGVVRKEWDAADDTAKEMTCSAYLYHCLHILSIPSAETWRGWIDLGVHLANVYC